MLGLGFVVVEPGQQFGQVGGGEFPLEWLRGLVVLVLERVQAVGDGVDIGEVVGREHFPLDDGEVDLYWFSQDACTGVCTMIALGYCSASRSIVACPRWEDPLSTIQNTRSAEA